MAYFTRLAAAVGAAAILLTPIILIPRPSGPPGGALDPTATASGFTTSPSPPPSTLTFLPLSVSGEIAIEHTVDGNVDIYLARLSEGSLVRLTDARARDTHPGWSPDGERLVFTRDVNGAGDLMAMNPEGGDVTALTATPYEEDFARFSPDGQTIAFWRGDWRTADTYTELWLMDADGANERRVIRFDEILTTSLSWSGDGMAIYFNRDLRTGGQIDIVRIDLQSKTVTDITDEAGDDSMFELSPDGTTIAFQSDRAPGGLFLMDADGKNVRHLIGSWESGGPVAWSPDGSHLVYLDGSDLSLYVIRADGSDRMALIDRVGAVAWRPVD